MAGNFYIAASAGPISIFDSSFSLAGTLDTDVITLVGPMGLGNDGTNIWIADSGANKVYKFSTTGELLLTLTSADDIGFNFPTDVKVSAGIVYVADGNNARVCSFDNVTGDFLSTFNLQQFSQPFGLFIDSDLIYVADGGERKALVYTLEGVLQQTIGGPGIGPGFFDSPFGVAVDGDGRVWVADNGGQKVSLFQNNGTILTEYTMGFENIGSFAFNDQKLYMTDTNGASTEFVIWTWANIPAPSPTPSSAIPEIPGTPSLTSPLKFNEGSLTGITNIYVDGNKTIQDNPYAINNDASISLAGLGDALLGNGIFSTVASGQLSESVTNVQIEIQGTTETFPNVGNRFSR